MQHPEAGHWRQSTSSCAGCVAAAVHSSTHSGVMDLLPPQHKVNKDDSFADGKGAEVSGRLFGCS